MGNRGTADEIEGLRGILGGPNFKSGGEGFEWSTAKDHVNEFGLPNDGYDYSQHLRTIGEWRFRRVVHQSSSAGR